MNPSSVWKKQTLHPDCRELSCPSHDPIRDWRADPSGAYILIRADKEKKVIELAVCDREHRIVRIFSGKKCEDIYHTIFQEEKLAGAEWFQIKEHIAYLGKELKKAELSLAQNTNYLQE
jgi:hypothetical protein